jgi:hypothetical protein
MIATKSPKHTRPTPPAGQRGALLVFRGRGCVPVGERLWQSEQCGGDFPAGPIEFSVRHAQFAQARDECNEAVSRNPDRGGAHIACKNRALHPDSSNGAQNLFDRRAARHGLNRSAGELGPRYPPM